MKNKMLETFNNNHIAHMKEANYIILCYLTTQEMFHNFCLEETKLKKEQIKKIIVDAKKKKFKNLKPLEEAETYKFEPYTPEFLKKVENVSVTGDAINIAKNYFSHLSNMLNPDFYKKKKDKDNEEDDQNNSNSYSNSLSIKGLMIDTNTQNFKTFLSENIYQMNDKKSFENVYEQLQKSDSRLGFAMVYFIIKKNKNRH
jgi:hypothetical protein